MSAQTQQLKVVFPKQELKVWYAGLSIETKLAAAMMPFLMVNGIGDTPDHGRTGVAILKALNRDIEAAEDLPEQLATFRDVYQVIRQGN